MGEYASDILIEDIVRRCLWCNCRLFKHGTNWLKLCDEVCKREYASENFEKRKIRYKEERLELISKTKAEQAEIIKLERRNRFNKLLKDREFSYILPPKCRRCGCYLLESYKSNYCRQKCEREYLTERKEAFRSINRINREIALEDNIW